MIDDYDDDDIDLVDVHCTVVNTRGLSASTFCLSGLAMHIWPCLMMMIAFLAQQSLFLDLNTRTSKMQLRATQLMQQTNKPKQQLNATIIIWHTVPTSSDVPV